MGYPIDEKLVIGISSNALFDLKKEDEIFEREGAEAYREYQLKHRAETLETGLAYPLIKRFLRINEIYETEQPIEIVLLSKSTPEAGIRIFNSIKEHNLNITRAAFMSGASAVNYIPVFNISLFLATNESDVKEALDANLPAGKILQTDLEVYDESSELRIAFDLDGDFAANRYEEEPEERFYVEEDDEVEEYREYEKPYTNGNSNNSVELEAGSLANFFKSIAYIQKLENQSKRSDSSYAKILKTAIVSNQSAPAHEKAINALSKWGIGADEMFMLGGIDKSKIIEIMKPHLYIDNQMIDFGTNNSPLIHIPIMGVSER